MNELPELSRVSGKSNLNEVGFCAEPFIKTPTQLIHSLEVTLPGEHFTHVIGIINLYPVKRGLEIVVMSIEGLVLFNADYINEEIRVLKRSGPFESNDFVEGLLHDVRLIFLYPDDSLIQKGMTGNGDLTCRFQTEDRGWLDVVIKPDENWEIRQYDAEKEPVVTVLSRNDKEHQTKNQAVPEIMVLESNGMLRYKITMRLLESVAIEN